MINRVLIRIKVVQMLYSYLLIQSHFMLESQPTPPTKEKRFAYSLYLDMLVLMVRISELIEKRGGYRPLADTRFVSYIIGDEKIKSLIAKYRHEQFPLERCVDVLADRIKDSGIYKNYVKGDKNDANSDIKVWNEIFKIIISPDPVVNEVISQLPNYSLRGVDRMNEMMAATFENLYSSQGNTSDALKELAKSMDKSRELYMRLLMLPVEITALREREIDEARHKYVPSEEDLNPNLRMVENRLVELLRTDPVLNEYVAKHKLSWLPEDELLISSLLKDIKESEIYQDYMSFPATDLHTDIEFWRNIFKHIIFHNPTFLEALEDKSIFWNDDLDIIGTFVLKTFRRFEEGTPDGEDPVLDAFKDKEDEKFGAELFSAVIRNKEKYMNLIDEFVNKSSWDTDRLAFMDVVIILTALAEILNFPKIPTSVSVNEYIELAKSYSTPKSGTFVHGLLGAIIASLRESGDLVKE